MGGTMRQCWGWYVPSLLWQNQSQSRAAAFSANNLGSASLPGCLPYAAACAGPGPSPHAALLHVCN